MNGKFSGMGASLTKHSKIERTSLSLRRRAVEAHETSREVPEFESDELDLRREGTSFLLVCVSFAGFLLRRDDTAWVLGFTIVFRSRFGFTMVYFLRFRLFDFMSRSKAQIVMGKASPNRSPKQEGTRGAFRFVFGPS